MLAGNVQADLGDLCGLAAGLHFFMANGGRFDGAKVFKISHKGLEGGSGCRSAIENPGDNCLYVACRKHKHTGGQCASQGGLGRFARVGSWPGRAPRIHDQWR